MLFTVWDLRDSIDYTIHINSKRVTLRELHKRILAGNEGCIKYPLGEDGDLISVEEFNKNYECDSVKSKIMPSSMKDTLIRNCFRNKTTLLIVDPLPSDEKQLDPVVLISKQREDLELKETEIEYLKFHNERLSNEIEQLGKYPVINYECETKSERSLNHEKELLAQSRNHILELDLAKKQTSDSRKKTVMRCETFRAENERLQRLITKISDNCTKAVLRCETLRAENERLQRLISEISENEPKTSDLPDITAMGISELKETRDKIKSAFDSHYTVIQRAIEKKMEEKATKSDCVICMERTVGVVLIPCGHICICLDCSEIHNGNCPLCRKDITKKQRIYQ